MKNITKKLQQNAQNLRVLYVEDDTDLGRSVTTYLQKFFKDVVTAADGREGLDRYNADTAGFDIVITDIKMPKLNGIEMIKRIKKDNFEQKIIITSAHTETDMFLDSIKLGVSGYIIKPIDYMQMNGELLKVAKQIVEHKENEAFKHQLQSMVEEKSRENRRLTHEKVQNYELTLFALVDMIESRDSYTAGHSTRVAKYSEMIARDMGYSKKECDMLYKAGILHDIGKVSTPDAVLLKPSKLNDLEYRLIQEHVSVSYHILHKIPMYKELSEIIYQHHERCDGSGYPQGLKEDGIHPLAKIMMVCDTFDAMTTNRIYKNKATVAQALAEIESLAGSEFDTRVVQSASRVLEHVRIDEDITQKPGNTLEEERFAYFFKDIVTDTYNRQFLDSLLIQNRLNKEYCCLDMVYLHHFTRYNKNYGWQEGDKALAAFGNELKTRFEDALVFRMYGDDFLILHSKKCDGIDIDALRKIDLIQKGGLEISTEHIDLSDIQMASSKDLEKYLNDTERFKRVE